MTNTDWNDIKGKIAVDAALEWGAQPKNFHDLSHAIARVIESAMLAGQTIGINETAANARRQFAKFQDGHGNDIGHLVPVLRPAG